MKSAQDIQLLVTRENLDPAVPADKKVEILQFALSDKLDDLLLRVGYSNAQVLNMTLQLMTVGKIRVEFDNFNERMELVHRETDLMSRADAITMFDAHLSELQGAQTAAAPEAIGATQKIVITPRQKPAPAQPALKRIANVVPPSVPAPAQGVQPQQPNPYVQPVAPQPVQVPQYQQPVAPPAPAGIPAWQMSVQQPTQPTAYQQPYAPQQAPVAHHPQAVYPQPATPTQVLATMRPSPKKKDNNVLFWVLVIVAIAVGLIIAYAIFSAKPL